MANAICTVPCSTVGPFEEPKKSICTYQIECVSVITNNIIVQMFNSSQNVPRRVKKAYPNASRKPTWTHYARKEVWFLRLSPYVFSNHRVCFLQFSPPEPFPNILSGNPPYLYIYIYITCALYPEVDWPRARAWARTRPDAWKTPSLRTILWYTHTYIYIYIYTHRERERLVVYLLSASPSEDNAGATRPAGASSVLFIKLYLLIIDCLMFIWQ